MPVILVASTYLKGRAFATINHLHHDDVVVVTQPDQLLALNLTNHTAWVIDEIDNSLELALRTRFAACVCCRVRRVDSDEVVEGLK